MILGLDPGPTRSAIVLYDGERILKHGIETNADILAWLYEHVETSDKDMLVIEQISAMGMSVGAELFETCFWSGRFAEAWGNVAAWNRLKRHEVKMHLCGSMKAKDGNIRQALIDRFGPSKEIAVGTTKKRGPLFGIKADEWSALAVAVVWWDLKVKR